MGSNTPLPPASPSTLPPAPASALPVVLPLALEHLEPIAARLAGREIAVFLDYDGTLTPLAGRPDLALLSESTRAAVRRLGDCCTVAVVSGRDRDDVQKLVGLDTLIYAGNHGFDIAGPKQGSPRQRKGAGFEGILDSVARSLDEKLAGIEGVLIEAKKISVAVHYRLVEADKVNRVRQTVEQIMAGQPELRLTPGKMVLEIQPRLDWDKGKAVLWLLGALNLDRPQVLPVYMGDDATDEDAFRALKDIGLCFRVAETDVESAADYRLRDPGEAERLLTFLGEHCGADC